MAGGCLLLVAGCAGWFYASLPEPGRFATAWPRKTAYMELRERQARDEGRDPGLRYDPVPLSRVPDHLERAVRVAEDAAFYSHAGIDLHELRAALEEAWSDDERLRGASTITMQLARNLYLSPDRNLLRKVREAAIALRMERRLSKGRILELYLSVVELGPDVFGVDAAARHYYGVPVSAVSRRQAAEIAATLPAPRTDNPATRTRRFLWRAELIRRRAFGAGPAPEEVEVEPPDFGGPDRGRDTSGSAVDTLAPDSVPADTVRPDALPYGTAPPDTGTATDTVPPAATLPPAPPSRRPAPPGRRAPTSPPATAR